MRLKTSKTCPFGHLYSYVGNGERTLAADSVYAGTARYVFVVEIASRSLTFARSLTRDIPVRWFWTAVGLTSAGLATVLAVYLLTWPPHEDEALAIFVARGSLTHVLHTVLAERGGAPLHFVLVWGVVHLGGGLAAVRTISLVFAVASIPVIAQLGSRLADRAVGAVAALLAAGSWVLLFHGIYGRMYSLFLFTSALSFLAMLGALERGGRRRFALWALALLATLASHPYAVLVLGSQAVYTALRRERLRAAALTLAAVALCALPFWRADLVLRDRFDVGLGGGGTRLGSPSAVARYFWWVSGDFSAGHHEWAAPVLVLAGAGLLVLALRRRRSALLTLCVFAVPALAFLAAKLHSTASPEARHLIFALPFFSTLLAAPLVHFGRARPPLGAAAATAAVVLLLVGEVSWAHRKTPPLFDGTPRAEAHARAQAAAWLVARSRPDDVLFGYEPVYLAAWQQDRHISAHALPRADSKLLADELRKIREPLGHGVWVFDASDTTNVWRRATIAYVLPQPQREFVARVFGPYLVIRSRMPLQTPARYLAAAAEVMRLGVKLQIGDAGINLGAIRGASGKL
jgi:Dolichyl-phosphate-mannose-protein mannosyltransferase